MPLSNELRARIDSTIAASRVVLFMKGTPGQPQCGFSAKVVGILGRLGSEYATVNVLEDPELREGIKAYANWPTVPQLYIEQEFVGGCDVVQQMFNTGELHRTLGLEAPARTVPEIDISDAAARMIREALENEPGLALHLTIDPNWQHEFGLGPVEGHEIRASSNGIDVLLDLDSAQRAGGLRVDLVETPQGTGLSTDNPNAPPPVGQLPGSELKARIEAGEALHLFDVREAHERERAQIDGSQMLNAASAAFIETLPKDAMLVFYCHFGSRSQSAADYFRLQGFSNVHNLVGGIDAWSQEIDAAVPRY